MMVDLVKAKGTTMDRLNQAQFFVYNVSFYVNFVKKFSRATFPLYGYNETCNPLIIIVNVAPLFQN